MEIKYKDWTLIVEFDYEKEDHYVGLSAQIYVNTVKVEGQEDNETLSDLMYDRYDNDPLFQNFLDEEIWKTKL